MAVFGSFFEEYLSQVYIPKIDFVDILEMFIIAFVLYHILVWIKDTRAWALLKGILVIVAFAIVAILFNLQTILWIASKTLSIGVIALIIIFQPELRKALEQLGRKSIISSIVIFDDNKKEDADKFNDKTINELVKASFELGKTKTGALIVIEREVSLSEFIKTGIEIDAIITSQLLINIFEHNTPLHDGAVVVRDNRVVAATCYLPLSENMRLSKELGTRHRAGVGVSEATDSLTIIVSEETGKVSIALQGKLHRDVNETELRKCLENLKKKTIDGKPIKLWKKGKNKHEKKTNA